MGEGAPGNRRNAQAADLGRYAGLGFQFAATLVAFGALGWWLDGKLGLSPWLLIAGVFLGATGGFLALIRAVGPPTRLPRSPQASQAPPAPPETRGPRGPRDPDRNTPA